MNKEKTARQRFKIGDRVVHIVNPLRRGTIAGFTKGDVYEIKLKRDGMVNTTFEHAPYWNMEEPESQVCGFDESTVYTLTDKGIVALQDAMGSEWLLKDKKDFFSQSPETTAIGPRQRGAVPVDSIATRLKRRLDASIECLVQWVSRLTTGRN